MTDDPVAALTAARAQTLAALGPLAQAQLDFSPGPRRWSIGEVADHLLLAEGLYRDEIGRLIALARAGERPYLKRSFADINVSPFHLPTPVLSMLEVPFGLMSRVIPDTVRSFITEFPLLPARNPGLATPRHGRRAADLRADLARSIADTRALIAANMDLDMTRMVSEHPLTGASNVPAILRFLSQHERRHQGQMEKVRSDSRFPRVSRAF